eukprot:TRINITY_DN65641_c0_g1_i1.p1 TRINITY_DN65641_c0_g1~~TRINITY_DN65641_c0_g1_i1.p1  ORF type:complete len:306 (+),score=105.10 TRINITY_DN65641_c0_g1_i1:83-1000(+)
MAGPGVEWEEAEKAFLAPDWAKDIGSGTTAGMCSKLIEYPFDTVKVRLQTDTTGRFTSGYDCLKQTYTKEGVSGIYRGVMSPIAGAMAENATLFWAYGVAQRQVRQYYQLPEDGQLSLSQLSLCGAFSGLAVAHVLSPVERVKCLMQLQELGMTETKYTSVFQCAAGSVKRYGLAEGLFKGHGAMLLREVPGNAAWYGCYELFCKMFCNRLQCTKENLPAQWIALAGAFGGCAYWSAFFPADVVGNNMRGAGANGFTATFKAIYQREGLKGLYKGWGLSMVRAFPANACVFTVYELVKRKLDSVC